MDLTRKEALKFHRQMWTEMQEALGDKPDALARVKFKYKWCEEHFPSDRVMFGCFLCEYARSDDIDNCSKCPIVWPDNRKKYSCQCVPFCNHAPISEILRLRERKWWHFWKR